MVAKLSVEFSCDHLGRGTSRAANLADVNMYSSYGDSMSSGVLRRVLAKHTMGITPTMLSVLINCRTQWDQ